MATKKKRIDPRAPHQGVYTIHEWVRLQKLLKVEELKLKKQGPSWFYDDLIFAFDNETDPATVLIPHFIRVQKLYQDYPPEENVDLMKLFFGDLADVPLFMGLSDPQYVSAVIKWRLEMGK